VGQLIHSADACSWVLPQQLAVESGRIAMDKLATPWLTVVMVMASLLASLSPHFSSILQFDRSAIASGEIWRLFTSNFTHWSTNHLFWDLSTFAGFLVALEMGLIGERMDRMILLWWILLGSLFISLGVYVFEPHFELYRGLSGLSVGGFVLLCFSVAREARIQNDKLWLSLSALGVVGVCLKLLYEFNSGNVLFVNDVFTVAMASHFVGLLSAVLVCLITFAQFPFSYRSPAAFANKQAACFKILE
jgi:rhomboid family GlyGly-CTERM serine protease